MTGGLLSRKRPAKGINMKAIDFLTDYLIKKGHIKEEDRELYHYGFDITFYSIWSTAVLLMIGQLLHRLVPSLIIVYGFYTFQSNGGGYHASTHLNCLLTMITGLLIGLSLLSLMEQPVLLWIVLLAGAFMLLLVPLVLHPNKSYLEEERKRLTSRSIAVTLAAMIWVITLNVFWNRLLYAFSAVFFLSGISRIFGKIIYSQDMKAM